MTKLINEKTFQSKEKLEDKILKADFTYMLQKASNFFKKTFNVGAIYKL